MPQARRLLVSAYQWTISTDTRAWSASGILFAVAVLCFLAYRRVKKALEMEKRSAAEAEAHKRTSGAFTAEDIKGIRVGRVGPDLTTSGEELEAPDTLSAEDLGLDE